MCSGCKSLYSINTSQVLLISFSGALGFLNLKELSISSSVRPPLAVCVCSSVISSVELAEASDPPMVKNALWCVCSCWSHWCWRLQGWCSSAFCPA